MRSGTLGTLLGLSAFLAAMSAAAQPPPDTNPPVIPPGGQPPGAPPLPGQPPPTGPQVGPQPAPPPPQLPAPPPPGPSTGPAPQLGPNPTGITPDVQNAPAPQLLQAQPGGVTSTQVAQRAAQTSYTAMAANENLRAAAARVDAAWAAFLPRLTLTARYTHLSSFTPPNLGPPAGYYALYYHNQTGTAPTPPLTAADIGNITAFPGSLFFPILTENYLLQANITVPISDYFLRIDQNYTAATHSREAFRYDAVAAKAKAAADGMVAYYSWLRARGAVVVAQQALDDQRTRAKDAQNQFDAGNASKADVLRAQAGVAQAELALEQSKNLADLTERQVRIAIHAREGEPLAPGESLDTPAPPLAGNIQQLILEAKSARYEVKSVDANALSARETAKVQRAGGYPQISAFADGIYANPNPRKFPQTQEWFPTWDVGAQLVWSPNDILTASAGASDFEARANALEAQRQVVRDGIEIEVFQAYQQAREADFALESSKRQLESAAEASRVARQLFVNGRGTYTNVIDAATEYTRALLTALNAQADARIARVRLDHALGRDARPYASP